MTVLILGGTDDEHAVYMLETLRDRGADAELLDSRWFPVEMRLANDPARGSWTLRLPDGRSLVAEQIRSVFWRCYNGVGPPALPDPEQSYIAGNDARSLFESLLMRLSVRWVNGWRGFQLHQTKPAALAMVASLGVPVPATLLGNDPEAVRAFVAAHPRCIFKPVQGGAHTRRVTAAHLTDANLRNLAYAPVTLQEEVSGSNIRVFVAGQRVLACEVHSDAPDFRDTDDLRITPHELPTEARRHCLDAAHALDLLWTGIDLRRTPEGRYVFLEANPSPMFLGFESRSGLPLTDALADLLTEAP
jgi:glutathione synthase/RimK-type ligase-like ATP-grasp enzyme